MNCRENTDEYAVFRDLFMLHTPVIRRREEVYQPLSHFRLSNSNMARPFPFACYAILRYHGLHGMAPRNGRLNGDVPLLLLRITHCKKRERRKKHCAAIRGEIYEAISYNG